MYMCWITVTSTLVMDLEDVTLAILSGLMANVFGTGDLLAFFAQFLFDTLEGVLQCK